MPWQISVFDRTLNTEDLTVGEAEQLEEDLGCSWLIINPRVSIRHFRAVVSILLAREMPLDVATEKVRALGIADVGDIEKVEDSRPTMWEDGHPKAEGGRPTPGSSPASDGSSGPLT